VPKIRVLVVEDSRTIREHLVETLSADSEIEVVGKASDGKTAIELCQRLRPDVMTLDMVLPVLSGLAVTEYVMAYCPTPILIVSASTNRGDLYKTYDALAAGALEVLEKPDANAVDDAWERSFVSTIKLVSRIKVITHMRGRIQHGYRFPANPVIPSGEGGYRLVAIGASTGGPAALVTILRGLPADFPLPILVVNHLGEKFGSLLGEWLDSQSSLRVGCAVDGEALPEAGHGRVILAPPGRHLVVTGGRLQLTADAERHSCRPSVDVLFESVAREIGARSIACLLTGMGKDGAAGLLSIRQAGGRTLAQDEATSTIFGMPREAARLGAVERIVGLPDVAATLKTLAAGCSSFPGASR
jgi:two-component system, chemotaxis family, protein-glutamate methylesterase/glutaminase